MTILVDSNIWLDLLTEDATWGDWSRDQVIKLIDNGNQMALNPIVYAEISTGFETSDQLETALSSLDIQRLQLPWEAAFPAAQAFGQYRRHGGPRLSLLPDFYIGAHALVSELKLLTRDVGRYRTYFPDVKLICPS